MTFEVISHDLAFPAFILLAALSLLRFVLYPVLLSALAKVPKAHWSCGVSSVWILWARYTNRENRTIGEAHRRYGPIVRLAPNEVSINDMESVKTVYQGGFDKHQWYSVFNNYGVPNVFCSIYAKEHSIRKRMVSHVYSKSYLHSSASLAAQADDILNTRVLPTLDTSSHEGQAHQAIDVHSFFAAAAMDFITAYTFGLQNSSNFIQQKVYHDHWLELYRSRKGYSFFSQELPMLSKLLSPIGLHLTARMEAANRELEEWCAKLCAATLSSLAMKGSKPQTPADQPVVLRALLHGLDKEERVRGKESPIFSTAISQRNLTISSELFDHILAGQETTGVALTYLSWHLSQSQDLQHQLRAELLSLTPNMRMESGKVNIPNSGQLDRLPLLHAVIIETVRLYAPAGGPEPRVTPHPSCRIGPYEIPGGVRISASAYNLHRDERHFPHAEIWDHTRWLHTDDMDEERQKEMNRQFWGFSSGGRMCLGSNFAMHEMKLLVAAIYTNYTSHIVDDEGIAPTDGYTSHPTSGQLWLRFERADLG
ncbi:cytochrome P450 family protein [Apiospora aurea]|uniref:Cytochrome P450 family protein n=1 Tax=Apiospora aurea TaxID=335848 RepID=A0ABR1PZB8_9PEZI